MSRVKLKIDNKKDRSLKLAATLSCGKDLFSRSLKESKIIFFQVSKKFLNPQLKKRKISDIFVCENIVLHCERRR